MIKYSSKSSIDQDILTRSARAKDMISDEERWSLERGYSYILDKQLHYNSPKGPPYVATLYAGRATQLKIDQLLGNPPDIT